MNKRNIILITLAIIPLVLLCSCGKEENESKTIRRMREFKNGDIIEITHEKNKNIFFSVNKNTLILSINDVEIAEGTFVYTDEKILDNNCNWENGVTEEPMLRCTKSINNYKDGVFLFETKEDNEKLIENTLKNTTIKFLDKYINEIPSRWKTNTYDWEQENGNTIEITHKDTENFEFSIKGSELLMIKNNKEIAKGKIIEGRMSTMVFEGEIKNGKEIEYVSDAVYRKVFENEDYFGYMSAIHTNSCYLEENHSYCTKFINDCNDKIIIFEPVNSEDEEFIEEILQNTRVKFTD